MCQGIGQRLVVSGDGEVTDLQYVPEVAGRQTTPCQRQSTSAVLSSDSWRRTQGAAKPACHVAAVASTHLCAWHKHPVPMFPYVPMFLYAPMFLYIFVGAYIFLYFACTFI